MVSAFLETIRREREEEGRGARQSIRGCCHDLGSYWAIEREWDSKLFNNKLHDNQLPRSLKDNKDNKDNSLEVEADNNAGHEKCEREERCRVTDIDCHMHVHFPVRERQPTLMPRKLCLRCWSCINPETLYGQLSFFRAQKPSCLRKVRQVEEHHNCQEDGR